MSNKQQFRSGVKEVLTTLWTFRGIGPQRLTQALHRVASFAGLLLLVISLPLYAWVAAWENNPVLWLVTGLILITGTGLMFARRLQFLPWLPILFTLAFSVGLTQIARHGTMSGGSGALLVIVGLALTRGGLRWALPALAAFSIAGFAVATTNASFDLVESLFLYGVNLASATLIFGAALSLYSQSGHYEQKIFAKHEQLKRSRQQDYSEIALLTQELRAPAAAIYSLTQQRNITPVIEADIKQSLSRLDNLLNEVTNTDSTTLPQLEHHQNLAELCFDVSQQIHPLMTGRNILFSMEQDSSENRAYHFDGLRVRGVLIALSRAMLFSDAHSVRCVVSTHTDQTTQWRINIDLTACLNEQDVSPTLAGAETVLLGGRAENPMQRELGQAFVWAGQSHGALSVSQASATELLFSAGLPITSISTPSTGKHPPPIATTTALKDSRVLIVDDDAMTRTSSRILLQNIFGAHVEQASDMAEALQLIEGSAPFDLLLSDFMMPGGTGTDLIAALPEQGGPRWIVVCTASAMNSDVSQLLDAGAHLVLPKPMTAHALSVALGELLSQSLEQKDNGTANVH